MPIIIPDFTSPTPEPPVPERVEHVAKALFPVLSEQQGGHTLMPWWCSPERQLCLKFARAAIAAMREPTPDMIREGDYFIGHSESVAGHVWDAMIDTALKE